MDEAQTYGQFWKEGIISISQEYFRSSQGNKGENKKVYLCLAQCSGGGSDW